MILLRRLFILVFVLEPFKINSFLPIRFIVGVRSRLYKRLIWGLDRNSKEKEFNVEILRGKRLKQALYAE